MAEGVIGQRFQKLSCISKDNTGRVFLAQDLETNSCVALKIEQISSKSLLENEKNMIMSLRNCLGFSKLIAYDETESYKYIALQLLGTSLEDRFIQSQRKFSYLDCCNYSMRLLDLISKMHTYDIIHRDIAPKHILFGPVSNNNELYLIDFGISIKYILNNHIAYSENCEFLSNLNFCSLNTHFRIQQSRRDDLESFCYVLAYLFTGNLP